MFFAGRTPEARINILQSAKKVLSHIGTNSQHNLLPLLIFAALLLNGLHICSSENSDTRINEVIVIEPTLLLRINLCPCQQVTELLSESSPHRHAVYLSSFKFSPSIYIFSFWSTQTRKNHNNKFRHAASHEPCQEPSLSQLSSQ